MHIRYILVTHKEMSRSNRQKIGLDSNKSQTVLKTKSNGRLFSLKSQTQHRLEKNHDHYATRIVAGIGIFTSFRIVSGVKYILTPVNFLLLNFRCNFGNLFASGETQKFAANSRLNKFTHH